MLRLLGALAETDASHPVSLTQLSEQNLDAPSFREILDVAYAAAQRDCLFMYSFSKSHRIVRPDSARSIDRPYNMFSTAAGLVLARALPDALKRPMGVMEAEWRCMWSAHLPTMELLPALAEANEAGILTWDKRCKLLQPFMVGDTGGGNNRDISRHSVRLSPAAPTVHAVTCLRAYEYAGFILTDNFRGTIGVNTQITVTDSGKHFVEAIKEAQGIAPPVPKLKPRTRRKAQDPARSDSPLMRIALENIALS